MPNCPGKMVKNVLGILEMSWNSSWEKESGDPCYLFGINLHIHNQFHLSVVVFISLNHVNTHAGFHLQYLFLVLTSKHAL